MNKQEIQNKINELKNRVAELEEELNKCEDKVFKPKYGEKYYYIYSIGVVDYCNWTDSDTDNSKYAIGNCFETEEEADFAIERLEVIAELEHFAKEHNEPLDWNNSVQYKYYIGFDEEIESIDYYCTFTIKRNDVYFSSKELARQAVAKIGEERIMKYYLQVE